MLAIWKCCAVVRDFRDLFRRFLNGLGFCRWSGRNTSVDGGERWSRFCEAIILVATGDITKVVCRDCSHALAASKALCAYCVCRRDNL